MNDSVLNYLRPSVLRDALTGDLMLLGTINDQVFSHAQAAFDLVYMTSGCKTVTGCTRKLRKAFDLK